MSFAYRTTFTKSSPRLLQRKKSSNLFPSLKYDHPFWFTVIPPLAYPDLGWPILAGTATSMPAPPSIPTLADRLHNYRQHVMFANAQSTVVTHAANQGATTTLVERTRNLRHWLKQTGVEATEPGNTQTTLWGSLNCVKRIFMQYVEFWFECGRSGLLLV